MTDTVTLIATSAMGIEAIVADEVRQLGYDPMVESGKITYTAPISSIPRSNLWLRTANRIKLKVGEFKATTFDELYELTKALPWENFIPEEGAFPVIGKSHKSTLYSVSDCQSIVKKAIVDRLKQKYGIANRLEETEALYRVEIALLNDIATLTIDTSGTGLHRREYRVGQGEAPLRETLAAALVLLTNWRGDGMFIDPFCGSGTIPIEAALIGQNIAPGINRSFASEDWPWIEQTEWDNALEEAEDVATYDKKLHIIGSDIDHKMIAISEQNALEIGLVDTIEWKQMQVADLFIREKDGYIVGNPPYGQRIKDEEYVIHLYRTLGRLMKKHPAWSVYILTSYKSFEQVYGKQATRRRKLFNGFIETTYYQYFGS